MMKRENSKDVAAAVSNTDTGVPEGEWLDYDCLICTNAIDVFGVYDCGHYSCAICALRIFKFGKNPSDRCCPMCRTPTKEIRVMQTPPDDEYSFDMEALKRIAFHFDKILRCSIETKPLKQRLEKLYTYVCPVAECWKDGEQEPFTHFAPLKEHLRNDHGLRYCGLCIDNRPSFLCEQVTYSDTELDNHNKGKCGKDPASFLGHPLCLFCSTRFYDGDALLKHMQSNHFSCDICNRGEFTFVFFKNRNKLLDHFMISHRLCEHPACIELDPMARVFANELELQHHEQRIHGAAPRAIPLESLGFQYQSHRPGRGGRQSQSPQAETSHDPSENPATGRDVTASTIWFDNNKGTMESVNMMPKTKGKTTLKKVAAGTQESEVQLASQVIPSHFEPIEVRDSLKRLAKRIAENTVVQPKTKAEEEAAAAEAARPAVPDNLTIEEYNAMLKEKLTKYLSKSVFEDFKKLSSDFIANRLMATEYYKKMTGIFSKEQLEDVFPPLAYSLTNDTKRAALIAARSMLNSKEQQQREERERQEAIEKAKAETQKSKQTLGGWKKPLTETAQAPKLGSAAKGAAKAANAGSVWQQKSLERKKPTLASPTESSSRPSAFLGETSTANVPAALLSGPQNMQRLQPAHVDPDDFPSLGGRTVPPPAPRATAAGGGKKGGNKRPQPVNAWFARGAN